MRKRMTSLLLTLVMLLSLVPAMGVTASAADGFVEVRTYEQLKTAVDKGDAKVKLMANIDTTNENGGAGVTDQTALTFIGDKNILDLNGYTLKLVSNTGATFFEVLKSLTIKDSGTGGRIDFEWGSSVLHRTTAIHVADASTVNLTVESGTLSSTYDGVTLIKSEGNLTIKGGKIQVPDEASSHDNAKAIYTDNSYGDNCKILISGGEISGNVMFTRDDSAVAQIPKGSECPIQISGGTFKGRVRPIWQEGKEPSARITEYSPVMEISGGTFEGRFADRFRGNLPVKLTGGTFKQTSDFYMVELGPKPGIEYSAFAESLGNSIIMRGNEIRTACYWSRSDWFYLDSWISLTATESDPITVIPNAWGMKSVTLDGTTPINYAKDWKGAVEKMDNSTEHTLTFEWYPLAQELKDAGYTYQTKCEHYISGSTAVQQTDTIAADKTSHTITIPAGVDPKVYSYDLHLNLQKDGSFVGIMSNEHIVKLVVNQAAPVEPVPTLAGKVYYTSGIVYGSPISIAASVTPAEATPAYQWQRSTDGGSTWTNIDGATSGRYTPVAADMGENVRIRVKVTAEGYLGEIVGAALKVSKAANNNYPEVIQLEAVQDSAGNYTGFKITNFDSDCEYVYSTTSTPDWSANQITSATAAETGLTSDTTYYVFARFKETNTHTAGSIVSKNSIKLFDYVPLWHVSLEGYDSGNTIYIKKGESVTLKVSADPSNANSWSEITFKDSSVSSLGTSNITISNEKIAASGTTATAFPNDHSITITGVSTGSATLDASYSGPTQPYYGRWYVTVYDDSTVANALRLESVYAYADITLSENDEAELPTDLPTLLPANSGYHLEWRILKRGTYGDTYVTENDNIKLEDGKIKPKAAHAASEKAQLELVAVKDGSTEYKTLPKKSLFYVTVTEAPVIELTGLTVAPTKVNLELNATYQLSAVKEPVNAPGELKWESSNTGVATVDNNTGEVTAVAKGEATITVSCNGKSASCTVTVDHTHNTNLQTWALLNDNEHFRSCTAGDDTQIEAHKVNSWTANTDGKTHTGTCTECNYVKTENHSLVFDHDDAPTTTAEGTRYYKCSTCGATKTESIPKLIEYTVTVKDDGNGKASADHIKAVAGTEIKLTATANSGYHFKEWQVVTGSVTINDNKFTMPDENVEVKAIFEKNTSTGGGGGGGVTTYAITVKSAKNGDVTASHKTASKGTAVTLTVDPDKGYVLDTLTVLDGKDKEIKLTEKNGKYTFTMPASKVTVAATFKASAPTGKNPFVDVPAGSYYEDAVVWAVEKGITSGTSAVTFDPNGNCTRAQAVTFLWRAAGSPAPKTKVMPFTDVPSGSYYYDAVLWAMEQGITKGTSDTAFSPNASCTRAQIVTFLWRANGSPAVSGNSAFTDVASDAYYAAAVTWAEKNNITGGIGGGLFGSNNNCTRAQIVTFLYRAMK